MAPPLPTPPGGTLDTKVRLRPDKYVDGIDDAERNFGRESRSLKACHEFLYKVCAYCSCLLYRASARMKFGLG